MTFLVLNYLFSEWKKVFFWHLLRIFFLILLKENFQFGSKSGLILTYRKERLSWKLKCRIPFFQKNRFWPLQRRFGHSSWFNWSALHLHNLERHWDHVSCFNHASLRRKWSSKGKGILKYKGKKISNQ